MAGQILPDLGLRGGDRKSSHQAARCLLKTWGISRTQSCQWQMVAKLSEADVGDYARQAWRRGKTATSYGLFRLAKTRDEAAKLAGNQGDPLADVARGLRSLADQQRRFGCVYADAPWTPPGKGRPRGFHIDRRLAQLPVMEVTAPLAHLYLKVAPTWEEDGKKVMRAWGFSWKASLTCTKASLGLHDVLQPVGNLVLLGVRGGSGCDNHGLPPSAPG